MHQNLLDFWCPLRMSRAKEKLMKLSVCLLTTVVISSVSTIHADQSSNEQSRPIVQALCTLAEVDRSNNDEETEDDPNNFDASTQEVLTNFAEILSHFFTIVLDPENPDVVVPQVGAILQNIVNIAIEATRSGDIEQLHMLREKITSMIAKTKYKPLCRP